MIKRGGRPEKDWKKDWKKFGSKEKVATFAIPFGTRAAAGPL
jgi:hypothetical protein